MFSDKECRKCWNIPTDRELCLRGKLNSGWSVHTENIFRKFEPIPWAEQKIIEDVIRRARELEQLEVERVGHMLCRLKNMTRNALGDGKKTCSMCDEAFGRFRSSFVYCFDCSKAVCEKCRIDTVTFSQRICMLCKICAENREVWKKSGGWFYGKFPTMAEERQKECIAQITGSPGAARAFDTWEHRVPDIVRLESFEPPEENHNDNSLYKDWTMNSTPDLNSMDSENEVSYVELTSFRTRLDTKIQSSFDHLSIQNPKLSASCPSLDKLRDESNQERKGSIRRKIIPSPVQKIMKKISNKVRV